MELRWKTGFLLAMAIALGFLGYTLIGTYGSGQQALLEEELNNILEENRKLVEHNRILVFEAEALRNRKDYLEKVAREELGLIKKNEIVFHFPENDHPAHPSKNSTQVLQPSAQDKHGKKANASHQPRGD